MKKIFLIIFSAILVSACTKDNPGIITNTYKVNEWIHSTMSENYLWSATMPKFTADHLEITPDVFFNSLKLRAGVLDIWGDRFSYITHTGSTTRGMSEYASSTTENDFGFQVRVVVDNAQTVHYFQIINVVPGSPADIAGIQRGDCFHTVNNTRLYSSASFSKAAASNNISLQFFYPSDRGTKSLRKTEYKNTPILYHDIYELSEKTGYLVYNHFTAGDNSVFFNELKSVFAEFKSAGIKNLILDMRFNGGGELTAAQQLASLLVDPSYLGKTMMYAERNRSFATPSNFEAVNFLPSSQAAAYNPGIENLYILTSKYTASASELIIHCLKPFFNTTGSLVVIGDTTYGKNVGGITITNKKYEWELSPITLRIHNINKVSGYETGIPPSSSAHYCDEMHAWENVGGGNYIYRIGAYGDAENEIMLRFTFDKIYGGNSWISEYKATGRPWTSDKSSVVGNLKSSDIAPQLQQIALLPEPALIEERIIVD